MRGRPKGIPCSEETKEKIRKTWESKASTKVTENELFRVCSRCEVLKSIDSFGKNKNNKNGIAPECKTCRNERYIAWKLRNPGVQQERDQQYKKWTKEYRLIKSSRASAKRGATPHTPLLISVKELKVFLDNHSGICDIVFCKNIATHLDHNHDSGKLRGYLCNMCNLGIGHFGDSPENLLAAVDYIQNSKSVITSILGREYYEQE